MVRSSWAHLEGFNPSSRILQISSLRATKARSSLTNLHVQPSRTLYHCFCFESQLSISLLEPPPPQNSNACTYQNIINISSAAVAATSRVSCLFFQNRKRPHNKCVIHKLEIQWGPKNIKKCRKTEKSTFSQKPVFLQV